MPAIEHGAYRFNVATAGELPEIFRLRYQIYVTEFGFESRQDHPQGWETDPWDGNAIHFVCRHNHELIGTLRLVLNKAIGLPVQRAAALEIPASPPAAEISRLAIAPRFRKGKTGNDLVALGLFQQMYHESKRRHIAHWYFITEEWISKTLQNMGFKFTQIGAPVSYHGCRAPYSSHVSHIEERLAQAAPEVYGLMIAGL